MADLKKKMGRVKKGGIKLGEEKVYTLSYTDDIMLMAEGEDKMRSMMGRLEEYLNGKGIEINSSKMKIVRFRKGVGVRQGKNRDGRGKR